MIQNKILGVFSLTFIAIAAVFSLRSLPIAAVYGWGIIALYGIAAIVFFIPSAYVCNQLTLQVPRTGGLYAWVREAFGDRIGFLGIWFEWINTVISLPTMLTFALFTALFPFIPHLSQHRSLELILLLGLFWGVTFINYLGIRVSSWFSNVCVIAGTLIPALLIIVLGAYWVSTGHHLQIKFSAHALIPHLHINTLAFLITLISSLSGIQAVAFHSQNATHLGRDYPKASLLSVCIILFLLMVGAIAIALVMPMHQLNAVGGLIVALQTFLNQFGLAWLLPVFAILIAVGVLAEVNVWLISPSRGMFAAAQAGQLPSLFSRQNRHGAPTVILLTQAIVFTILSLVYLLLPTVNSGYWLLSTIFGQLTLLMWILVFASAIRLCSHIAAWKRWAIAGTGLVVCAIVFLSGFIPTSLIVQHGSVVQYETLLIIGITVFALLPIAWVHRKK